MQTSNPCSTISYNTLDFLKNKLQSYVNSGVVDFWCLIEHKAEGDDLKDHIHLLIIPNKRIDTGFLKTDLQEFDAKHPDKPLGVVMFTPSKVDEWFLYNLHYEPYLKAKLLEKLFHYEKENFISSDENTLAMLFTHAMSESEFMKQRKLFRLVEDDTVKTSDLVYHGSIPLSNATGLYYLKKMRNQGE